MFDEGDNAMPNERYDDIYSRLNQTDVHVTAMRTKIDGLENAVSSIAQKLDSIAGRMSAQRNFEPVQVLTFIALSVAIIGSAATAITYVASNINESRLRVIEYRLDNPPAAMHNPMRAAKRDMRQ